MYLKTCLILCLYLVHLNAVATNLVDVFNLAEKNDPIYMQAAAKYRATLESKPQALSQLLPSINLSGDTYSNDQDISSNSNFGGSGDISFNSHGYSLSLSQPIFRYDRYLSLQQADTVIRQADTELAVAQQELIIRITERYFNVLSSIDNLELARSEVESLSRQLEQANQRFEVGLSAITDVAEAQAGYDLAMAREIQAINEIDNAREAMRELTGEYVTEIASLGNDMPLVKPIPDSIDKWTETALNQNLSISATSLAADIARKGIDIQKAGHYPTLDFAASKNYDSSGGRLGDTQTHGERIGLELNVPLYSGGLTSSKIREAYEDYNVAMYSLEQVKRSANRLTRETYLGVISGISQVKALRQAVVSSETALKATEAGFEVGTRTAVDVVASQRATFEARRNYSQAKYDYILNSLKLKQAAGTLSPEDLQQINLWLNNS